jgi:hypothetical protein
MRLAAQQSSSAHLGLTARGAHPDLRRRPAADHRGGPGGRPGVKRLRLRRGSAQRARRSAPEGRGRRGARARARHSARARRLRRNGVRARRARERTLTPVPIQRNPLMTLAARTPRQQRAQRPRHNTRAPPQPRASCCISADVAGAPLRAAAALPGAEARCCVRSGRRLAAAALLPHAKRCVAAARLRRRPRRRTRRSRALERIARAAGPRRTRQRATPLQQQQQQKSPPLTTAAGPTRAARC